MRVGSLLRRVFHLWVVLLADGWAVFHYYVALRPQGFLQFFLDAIGGWQSSANGPLALSILLLICSLLCVSQLHIVTPARILPLLYLGSVVWHSLFLVAYAKKVGIENLLKFAVSPNVLCDGEIRHRAIDRWVHPFTVHWAAAALSAAGAVSLLISGPLPPLRPFRGKGRTIGQKCRSE
jgi:hypothetical protein